MGFIYLIRNKVNNKCYVGQTIRTPEIRFRRHCEKQNSIEDHMAIKRAIYKYGKENFSLETLEECDNSMLDEREIYWIAKYDSFNNGYNLTTGGQFGATRKFILNEEQQNEACDMYKDGVKTSIIARKFNCDPTTIIRCVRNHGIEVYDRRLIEKKVDLKEFEQYLINENPTPTQVAKKYGIDKSTTYTLLKKLNNPNLKFNSKPASWARQIKDIDTDELMKQYMQGISIRELAVKFHIKKKKISEFINQFAPKNKRVNCKNIEYNPTTSVRTLTDNAEG